MIVNGIVSLISLSDLLLLVYRNAGDLASSISGAGKTGQLHV